MKKSAFCWLLTLALLLPVFQQVQASSDGYVYFGETKTAVYNPLHPYTLNWSGDVLDRGGMSLADLTITSSSSAADIVMNQYGALGARSIVKLSSGKLEDAVPFRQQGALSSITMAQGDLYLIELSTGKYAKLRIDRITATQVSFSYAIEQPKPVEPESEPTTPAPPKPSPTVPPATGPTKPTPTAPKPEAGSEQAGVTKTIVLTIGDKQVDIDGKKKELQAAPVARNNTTLVPLRIITEEIGAKLTWSGKDKKITLQLNDKTVVLYIDNKQAWINGKPTTLTAAPIANNGVTLVPIRFLVDHFGMKINYDKATQRVTVTGQVENTGNSQPPVQPTEPIQPTEPTEPIQPAEPADSNDYSAFIGTWKLWIEGGAIPIFNPATGEYVSHKMVSGADGGTLSIGSNGTYTLKTYATTQTGTWRPARNSEVWGYDGGIILETSGGGTDAWAMYSTPSGKIAMAYDSKGKYTDGSVIWIIQFILEKGK